MLTPIHISLIHLCTFLIDISPFCVVAKQVIEKILKHTGIFFSASATTPLTFFTTLPSHDFHLSTALCTFVANFHKARGFFLSPFPGETAADYGGQNLPIRA
jgi:hypothetical protein